MESEFRPFKLAYPEQLFATVSSHTGWQRLQVGMCVHCGDAPIADDEDRSDGFSCESCYARIGEAIWLASTQVLDRDDALFVVEPTRDEEFDAEIWERWEHYGAIIEAHLPSVCRVFLWDAYGGHGILRQLYAARTSAAVCRVVLRRSVPERLEDAMSDEWRDPATDDDPVGAWVENLERLVTEVNALPFLSVEWDTDHKVWVAEGRERSSQTSVFSFFGRGKTIADALRELAKNCE